MSHLPPDKPRALLVELRDYLERLKHRADVRGGPDVSAMGIADEAIAKIDEALAPSHVAEPTETGYIEQLHFMQRQAQMLAEEGNDVSSKVMSDAAKMVADVWLERERYRKGMDNWKRTAEAKDAEFVRSIASSSTREPVEMLLFCPRCNEQHIDAPDDKGWTNPPHATHTCQGCGLLWRPSNENTTGVPHIEVQEEKHLERIRAAWPIAPSATERRTSASAGTLADDIERDGIKAVFDGMSMADRKFYEDKIIYALRGGTS